MSDCHTQGEAQKGELGGRHPGKRVSPSPLGTMAQPDGGLAVVDMLNLSAMTFSRACENQSDRSHYYYSWGEKWLTTKYLLKINK